MTDSLLDDALVRLDDAVAHLNIDPDVIEKLKYARETTKVRLMIRMDDGSRKSFFAWRCRYDDTRGPTKGGIRSHPDTTADRASAMLGSTSRACLQRTATRSSLSRIPREPSSPRLDCTLMPTSRRPCNKGARGEHWRPRGT